jgi:IclR family transcriptional regulator, KDG regulon repressor
VKTATNSLDRALLLLKIVEQTPGGLKQTEICGLLGIPKSTCSYIANKLAHEGFLIRDESAGRFKIGLATVSLAHGALREIGIRSVAEPALYKLTNETGLSAGIGVLERGQVLLVDRVEGPGFVRDAVEVADGGARRKGRYRLRDQRDIGRELPAHTTALGKVLMAYLSRAQVLKLIAEQGLLRRTPKTIVSKSKLLAKLAKVREQGYAIADEEASMGVRSLSLPIFDSAGVVRAAVSVNGSPAETVWRDLDYLVKLVETAARDISRRVRS